MITELWDNRYTIFKNYITIIRDNIVGITTIFIILLLLIIYAYLRYKSFQTNIQHEEFINLEPEAESLHEFTKSDEPASPFTFTFINPGSAESKNIYDMCMKYYLSGFNQPNIQARGFDKRTELERTYKTMLIPISSTEETNITQLLSKKLTTIPNNIIAKVSNWINKASIAKGATWLESGMPHTHVNTMIMNANWFTNITLTTYFHELFHVIQRNNPEPFTQLYENTCWNFIYVNDGLNNIQGLESIKNIARMNPDANDFNWVWLDNKSNKYYWINAIFNNVAPSSLLDVKYLAYPLIRIDKNPGNKNQIFKYISSQPIELKVCSSFTNMFGIGYNHYHPNEIASQYAEYYFCSCPEEIKNKPAYQAFVNWLETVPI